MAKHEIEVDAPRVKELGYEPAAFRIPTRDDPIWSSECGGGISLSRGYDIHQPSLILRKIEPVRESRWMNVYPPVDHLCQYNSRAQCRRSAAETAIGFIRIDYENGVPVHVALEPAEGEG